MKKIYLVLSLAAVSLAFTQSCIKCDLLPGQHKAEVLEQTANITVAENTSYTYTVPVSAASSTQITTGASHAKASTVTTDANGNTTLQYTPAANYVGSDVVILTTHGGTMLSGGCFGGGQNNGHHSGGNCGNHHGNDESTTVTTLNITVTPASDVVVATATRVNDGISIK